MLDANQVRTDYMQIPMALRVKLADAIDEEFVGPFLKSLLPPELHPLVDTLSHATPDQVQPGPGDMQEMPAGPDAEMAQALTSSPQIS